MNKKDEIFWKMPLSTEDLVLQYKNTFDTMTEVERNRMFYGEWTTAEMPTHWTENKNIDVDKFLLETSSLIREYKSKEEDRNEDILQELFGASYKGKDLVVLPKEYKVSYEAFKEKFGELSKRVAVSKYVGDVVVLKGAYIDPMDELDKYRESIYRTMYIPADYKRKSNE